MSDRTDILFLEKQRLKLQDFECEDGWILDFGGGGEGVIGQLKGSRVVAIDLYKRELVEALEQGCQALLIQMDGRELKFLDNTFSTVTAFYSLMYVVEQEDLEKIFQEIHRVLKSGGKFFIWDSNLTLPKDTDKKIIAFKFSIILPSGKTIETGYGTPKSSQSKEQLVKLSEKVGFKVISSHNSKILFHLVLKKP